MQQMRDGQLIEFLQHLLSSHWGMGSISVLMMLESMPIVGLFVPGVFLMVALGSLAHAGQLPFGELVVFATAGALAGDSLGYWLGFLRGAETAWGGSHKRIRRGRKKAEALLAKRGRLAVFIGRFVWFFHPAVPVIAGATGIRPGWFYVADIPAAAIWVALYGGIGYLATGVLRERALETLSVLGVIVAVVLILLFYRWFRKRRT